MRSITLLVGIFCVTLSFAVDFLFGSDPGFGLQQVCLLVVGLFLVITAVTRRQLFGKLGFTNSRQEGLIGFHVFLRKKLVFVLATIALVAIALELICGAGLTYVNARHLQQRKTQHIMWKLLQPPVYPTAEAGQEVFGDVVEKYSACYAPYYEWRGDINQNLKTIHINRDGFRGPELREKSKQVRVLLCGGSTAWGFGAKSEDVTLRTCFEQELKQRFPNIDWEVICLAEPAYILRQERIRLDVDGLPLQAEYAIFIDGFNDVHSLQTGLKIGDHRKTPYFCARLNTTLMRKAKEQSETSTDRMVQQLNVMLHQSNTFSLLDSVIREATGTQEVPPPLESWHPIDTAEHLLTYFEQESKALEATAVANGLKVAMVLQPNIYSRPKLTENDQRIITTHRESLGGDGIKYEEGFRECYALLEGFYNRTSTESTLAYLDHSKIFDDTELVFIDNCHVVDEQYKPWAAKLVDDLVGKGWFVNLASSRN